MKASRIVAGVVVVASLLTGAAGAQDEKKLEWRLIPYIWLPGIDGTITTGPITTSPDVCFTEIADNATCLFGAFGRVEGWYDRFGFYVDGGWTTIRFEETGALGNDIDVDSDLAVVDFGLMYSVADWKLDQARGSDLKLDAYVGGRWMYVGVDVDLALLPDQSANENWVDPVVGGRVTWNIDRHWAIIASGDIGGFGVSSDITWEAMGYLAYKFPMGKSAEGALLVGYKAIGDDYSTGSGLSTFEWDVVLHGPVIGFAFQF